MVSFAKSLSERLTSLSAFCALAIMVLGVSDVTLRYAFNAPIAWAFETLTLLLLPSMFFLALAETYRRREHVFVDLLLQRLSPTAQRALHRMADVVSLIVLALICKGFVEKGLEAFAYEDVYVIADMEIPAWLTLATPILGLIVAIVVLLTISVSRSDGAEQSLSIE